jgi:hypothetical protein
MTARERRFKEWLVVGAVLAVLWSLWLLLSSGG